MSNWTKQKRRKNIFIIINKLQYFEQSSYNEKYGENHEIEQVMNVSKNDDCIFNTFECLNFFDSLSYQIEKEEFRKDTEKYIYALKKVIVTVNNLEEDGLVVQRRKYQAQ